MPIRVVHLIEQLAPGGAERQLVELVGRLDRARYQSRLIAGWNSGFQADQLAAHGVTIQTLRSHPGGARAATPAAILALRTLQPDIIHAWGFTPNVWGALARLLSRRVRFVAGIRGYSGELTAAQSRVERALQNVPDAIVSNTRRFADEWIARGTRADKVHVIPNGIDLARFPIHGDRSAARHRIGVPPESWVIGMVASMRRVKRWDVLLRAAADLIQTCDDRPAVRVVAVGDGAQLAEMRHLSVTLGIEMHVQFLGERSDVDSLIPGFDVVVSTSDSEGFSNTILEAMAASRPVIATAVGGTPEVVVEGQTGLLIPAGDTSSLTAAMLRLIRESEFAQALGLGGRKRAEDQYDLARVSMLTGELYDSLMVRAHGS